MASYAKAHDLLREPRRCLVGSNYGNKILLASPLLRRYLALGLKVTRIYKAIEFKKKKPFAHLSDEIIDVRRAADSDPDMKPRAETAKLEGNS
jgi:hypothetical protein